METLHPSLRQTQGLLGESSPLMSESTERAVEKAIKYGTLLSTESEWDRNAVDHAKVFEILDKFAAKGSEGYSTPPLCSNDTYLTTSI